MDSDAKSTKSEEDLSTKYVLNYYRKFSQNKDLPKYFSGTSLSYLPKIKDEVQNEIPEITIKTDVDVIITSLDEARQSETVDSSPTSSLRSNRKLEWDNGADIGYSNCLPTKKIHKSCSLPLLSELKHKQVAFVITQPSDQPQAPKSESSSDSNVKLVVFPYSSTSEENSSAAKCSSLSSSSPEEKKDVVYSISSTSLSTNGRGVNKGITPSSSSSTTSQRISSFKSTLSHLKKKIGLPDAQSTPITVEEVEIETEKLPDTPVMKNHEKPVKQLLLTEKRVEEQHPTSKVREVFPKESSEPFKNIVESDSDGLSTNSQQNPTDIPSKEEIDERKVVKQGKRVINLGITKPIFVECISTPPLPMNKKIQTQTEHLSVAVQTDHISEEELLKIVLESHKNENQSLHFFEHHSSDEKNSCSTQTTTDVEASKCDSFEFVKPDSNGSGADKNGNSNVQSQASTNPDEMVQTSQSSSQNIHLAEAVSTNKLDSIGEDIEKSVYILQKLLKSKKYDPATKKRYVKKILGKISESKYFEESSTSSELFFPKKSFKTDSQKIPQNNVVQQSTDSSIERSQQSDLGTSRFPRKSEGKAKVSPRKKTLQIKTFSQNIASIPDLSAKELSSPTEIIPVEARDMRKNLFTLTNNEFSAGQYERHVLGLKTSNIEASMSNNDASLEKHFDSCSTSKSYQNWKEDKTLSEKTVEQKYFTLGDGDNLVNLADKERENQINWINREMKHLDRLKQLLEKPPVNEDVAKETRTTTVYSVSRKSDRCDKGDDGSRRKFVIETKLDEELINQKRNFRLNGNKFTVANLSEHPTNNRKSRPILADIAVTSSDTTTNIIVTTICEKCRRGPCICVDPIGDVAKENVCRACRKRSCTCSSLDAIKSSRTVCLCCRKAVCSCTTNFTTSTGAIPKRCPLCRSYPCICSSAGSKDYDGQFIPVSVPKVVFEGRRNGCLSSSRSPTFSRSSTGCSKCRKCPCVCAAYAKSSDGSSKEEQTSKQSSMSLSGSLSKVFTNCNCRAKSKCDCGFVERLLRHFEKDDFLKDIGFEDNSAQTEPENRPIINNVGVQTQSDLKNQNLQTSSHQQSKLLQTDESRGLQYPQTTSIQTLSQMKHLKSKSVGSKPYRLSSRAVVTENISHHSANTQAAAQDGTTMTVGVKETSTENGRLTAIDTASYQNIAAQTSAEKNHLGSQAAEDWTQIFPSVATETNIKSFQSANVQAASQDGTTMTESRQATSTDDVKDHSISLDEATSYENQQIANRVSQSTEPRLQHVNATSQTDNLMPEYSNNIARSKSDTRDAITHVNRTRELSQTREASAHGISIPETFFRDTQFDAQLRAARTTISATSTRDDFKHEPSVRDVQTGVPLTSLRKSSMRDVESGNSLTRIVSNRGTSIDGTLSGNAQTGEVPLIRKASVRDTKTGDSLTRIASTRGTLTDGTSTLDVKTGDDIHRGTSTRGTVTRDPSMRDTKTGDSPIRVSASRGTLPERTSTLDAQTGDDKSRDSLTRGTGTREHPVHDTKTGDSVTGIVSTRGISTDRISAIDAQTGEDKYRDTLARGTFARETSVRDTKTGDSLTRVASNRGTLTDGTPTLDAQTGEERTRSTLTRGTFTRDLSAKDAKTGESLTRVTSTRSTLTDGILTVDAQTGEEKIYSTLTRGTLTRVLSARDAKTGNNLVRATSTRGTLTDGTSTLDAQIGEEKTYSTLTRGTLTREFSARDAKTGGSLIRETSTRGTLTDGVSTRDVQTGGEDIRDTLTRGTFTRETQAHDAKIGSSANRVASTRDTQTYEAKRRESKTQDASSPELSAHQKINDDAARSRTRKSGDFEQVDGSNLSKDCACACGFIRKVHRRKRGEMEKEPARMESVNSSGWNDSSKMLSSTGTTNGTTSNETTTTPQSETSLATCVCCKRRTAMDQTTMLRTNNEEYPLCRCCAHKKPILTSVCYSGPEERVCTCRQERKTASADRFRRVEEYCACAKPSRGAQNGRYCSHCQFKLKKTQRSGNGIAYTLTLESESPKRERRQHRKRPKRLEEIKVKVPCPYSRKRRWEKENFSRRGGSRSRARDASLEGEGGEGYDVGSEFEETKGEENKREGGDRETKNKENFTLQEYLRKNRPDFIDSAEYRRQAVVTARSERQQETDDVKLRFIEDNTRNNKFKGTNILFTEKEMKEITKRNYKKLPEVQQKLHNFREQRLRSADKMIVDIFKRKIQGSVLKGKRSFPIDTNIVNLY